MAIVKRANRLLTVKDEDVAHYLSIGYDQVDKSGAVLQAGKFTSTDKAAADKISSLEAENAALKSENADLKARVAELEVVAASAEATAAKPTK